MDLGMTLKTNFGGRQQMNALNEKFTYPVKDLLKTVMENRTKHINDYKDAMTNYEKILKEELGSLLKAMEDGEEISHHINLRQPVSYEKEYTHAIRMLEMTSNKSIEIDGYAFAKLVMDEWEWQNDFKANTMAYSSGSLKKPGAYSNVRI